MVEGTKSATSADTRAVAPRPSMVLGGLRALPTSPADCVCAADHSLGPRRLEQPNSPLRTLHRARRQRRNPATSELGRHGSRLGTVPWLGRLLGQLLVRL